MDHQPFSVAISVYKNDNPLYFDRALESITDKQTIKPDEIVLVVDGPVPDKTNKVIEKYSQRYNFKTIRLETNGGLGNALKIATENCSNELIARMDSDDISKENRFELQLRFLDDNPNVEIVGGNISEFIGNENNIVSYRVVPTSDAELKKYIKKRCPFNHMTVMYRKKSIMSAGGYLNWHYNEDYYLWLRMYLNSSIFANMDTILVNVRTGNEQIARRGGKKYFKSEVGIQKYMLKNRIIVFPTYLANVFKRLVIQILLPNKLRAYLYKKIIRKRVIKNVRTYSVN